MKPVSLACDQAVFTSIRGPMGEGYRIIAASKGIRAEEKQAITRNSPSHDSLCPTAEGPIENDAHVFGAAFYALPSGRLCVAYSCFAGAEHTGRGGQRVYTLTLVFAADQFAAIQFNAFHVVRAMLETGLTQPVLSPQQALPEVELPVMVDDRAIRGGTWCRSVASPARKRLLQELLDDHSVIVNLNTDWLDAAEGLILGLPGPMRARVSWAAGLKFSIGRGYRLHMLYDGTPATKSRTAGQRIEFIEPTSINETVTRSIWVAHVERIWEQGNLSLLSQHTSRPYRDAALETRERIARLFNIAEDLPKTETVNVLSMVAEYLVPRGDEVERGIATEFVQAAGRELTHRFTNSPWNQMQPHWPVLLDMAKRSANGAAFACPIIESALLSLLRTDPLAAARAALPLAHFRPATPQVTSMAAPQVSPPAPAPPAQRPSRPALPGLPSSPYLRKMLTSPKVPSEPQTQSESQVVPPIAPVPKAWDELIDEVLTRLVQNLEYATDETLSQIAAVIQPWRSARPSSPLVKQLAERANGLVRSR